MITAAAIRENSGTIHIGKTHVEIIKAAIRAGMIEDFEEGFITQEGKFVNRREAAIIAFNCGQIKEQLFELRSQDLSL